MIHRITIASNPRILIIFLLSVGLPAGSLVILFTLGILWGIILLAISGYIAYHLMKYGISNLKSRIETAEDGLTISIAYEEPKHLEWDQISHSGLCLQHGQRPSLYIYAEKTDQLVTIPDEYTGFLELSETIERNAPFETVTLDEHESIKEHLAEKIGYRSKDENGGETASDPTED